MIDVSSYDVYAVHQIRLSYFVLTAGPNAGAALVLVPMLVLVPVLVPMLVLVPVLVLVV